MSYIESYNYLVQQLASEYSRRYPVVERDDVAQEMWVWFVAHPNKYNEWSALDQKDCDKLIAKSLRNASLKFCEREKAKHTGYHSSDLYYYDASVIEAFLPTVISNSYEMPAKIQDLNASSSSTVLSEGNNWLTLRSDIAKAYHKLSEAKQNVLRLRFSTEQPDWAELSKDMDTSPDGARMKVQRAVNSIIKHLGGWKPYRDDDSTAS
jgi:DNA-directed RNA polymerase specialized sigma subunit